MMTKKLMLYYADDDSDDLLIFSEVASALGAEVKLFNNGEKLLGAMLDKNVNPSIVFVDLNMPGKSGNEVIAEIRASSRWKKIPTVVLSTASDQYNIEKSRAVGADLYMTKFTSITKLRDAIQHALNRDWCCDGNNFVYAPN